MPLAMQPFISGFGPIHGASAQPRMESKPMSLHLSAVTAALSSWTLNSQFAEGSKRASLIFPSRPLCMARAPNLQFSLQAENESASCDNPIIASVSNWAPDDPLSIARSYLITARVASHDQVELPFIRLEADAECDDMAIQSRSDTVFEGNSRDSTSRTFEVSLPWHASLTHSAESCLARTATVSFEFSDPRTGLRVCEHRIVHFEFLVPLTQRYQLRPLSDETDASRMSLRVLLQASPLCGAWISAYRIQLPPGCDIEIDHNQRDRADDGSVADSAWRVCDWIVPPGQVRTLLFELTMHAAAIVDSNNFEVEVKCVSVSPARAKRVVAELSNPVLARPEAERTSVMRLLPVVLAASNIDVDIQLASRLSLPTSIVSADGADDETRAQTTRVLTCSWLAPLVANPAKRVSTYDVHLTFPSPAASAFRRGIPIELSAEISVRGSARVANVSVDVVCDSSQCAVLGRQRALFALPSDCTSDDRQCIGVLRFRLIPLAVGRVALPAFRLRETARPMEPSLNAAAELGHINIGSNLAVPNPVDCDRVRVHCTLEDVFVSL